MPNRILKESITTSVSLSHLSAEEERHFYRLIVQADDFGCFQAHPSIIRAAGYGLLLDKVTSEQSAAWTQALASENIIHLYEADSKPYGHFINWAKYQQMRAQRRKWPEPACEITCNQVKSDAPVIQSDTNTRTDTNPTPNTNKTRPHWEPPVWFLPLTLLSGYKETNHKRAAKGIEAACVESGVEVEKVVKVFAEGWPALKLKYRWSDPVSTLQGVPLEVAINKIRNGRPSYGAGEGGRRGFNAPLRSELGLYHPTAEELASLDEPSE